MRALFVLGRALFGGFFAYNGINHILETKAMSQYASAKGVPRPAEAVRATGALLVAGGASVVAGLRPRTGLALLIAFLGPTTLTMHRFWEISDPAQRQAELVNFGKNVALLGAALALMEIDDPWPASVDSARTEEEMFINLGGRELRSLPA